jgi:hypothetical protein
MGYQFNVGVEGEFSFDYAFSAARVGEGSDHLIGLHYTF